MSDNQDLSILDQETDDDRRKELETILVSIRTRKLNEYEAGVLNARLIHLLNAGRGGRVPISRVAEVTGQPRRSFDRRVQLAKELADPSMEDIREEVVAGRLSAAGALELVAARRQGHPAPVHSLPVLRGLRKRQTLTTRDQDLLRGFIEGARWAHQALLQEPADSDWLASLAHDWKESQRGA